MNAHHHINHHNDLISILCIISSIIVLCIIFSIVIVSSHLHRDNVHHLLSELRPDAVPLVDAWNFSDAALESALGRRDGNVYETLYNWASQTPLNQKAAKEGGVDVEGYTKHVKKVLEGGVNTEPMRSRL